MYGTTRIYLGHGSHRHIIKLVCRTKDSSDGCARLGQSKIGIVHLPIAYILWTKTIQRLKTYNVEHRRDEFLVMRRHAFDLSEISLVIMENNLLASK